MGCSVSIEDSMRVAECISRTPLVLALQSEQIEDLSRMVYIKRFPKGAHICSMNDNSKGVHLLIEGTVQMGIETVSMTKLQLMSRKDLNVALSSGKIRKTEEKKVYDQALATNLAATTLDFEKPAPHVFTTNAFWLDYSKKVRAGINAIAFSDCEIAIVSRGNCNKFRKKYPGIGKKIKDVFSGGIKKTLKSIDFLSTVADEDLRLFAKVLKYRILAPDEVLFREGDVGKNSTQFYIVYQGMVDIFKSVIDVEESSQQKRRSQVQNNRRVARLGPGKFFGEISLLSDMPRTATVRGGKDVSYTVLLYIEKKEFHKFVEVIALDFVMIMKERICDAFRSTDCAFFKTFPKSRMGHLARECELIKVEKGEWVFREGDIGDRFYIIVGGVVSVFKEGKMLGKLGAKHYFGEIALISDSPRTAGVQAKETVLLLAMTKRSFRNLFFDRPESLAEVELKILGNRSTIRSVIYHPEGFKIFEQYLIGQFAAESLRFWKAARDFRHSVDYIYDGARRHSLVVVHRDGKLVGKEAKAKTNKNVIEESRDSYDRVQERLLNHKRFVSGKGSQDIKANDRFSSDVLALGLPFSPPVTPQPGINLPTERDSKSSRRTHTVLFETEMGGMERPPEATEPVLTKEQATELVKEAKKVFLEYIRDGAPQQVNIKGSTKLAIEKAIKDDKIDTQIFVAAEREAIKLLNRDKFTDFKTSQSFRDLIDLVCKGTYVVGDEIVAGAKKMRRGSKQVKKRALSIRAKDLSPSFDQAKHVEAKSKADNAAVILEENEKNKPVNSDLERVRKLGFNPEKGSPIRLSTSRTKSLQNNLQPARKSGPEHEPESSTLGSDLKYMEPPSRDAPSPSSTNRRVKEDLILDI
ncbi:hypothetical protein AAMO2058_000170100 [Amorphochlora amoebiformis]